MKLVCDGIVFGMQYNGGVSRLFGEILPRICDLDSTARIKLLMPPTILATLPIHPHIAHCYLPQVAHYLRPRRFWARYVPNIQQAVSNLWTGTSAETLWHSTYYTLPERWAGNSVVTVHDMIHERFSQIFDSPEDEAFKEQKRRCILSASAIICVSAATRNDVCSLYNIDAKRISVIPNGYGKAFRVLSSNEIVVAKHFATPFILYVGSRGYHKNFSSLLAAFSLWNRRDSIALTVVGNPWSAAEEAKLLELGIRDQVTLLNDIDDSMLCQLYNQALAFVYPSLYEGFGIPLLEAMACACPIIASKIPSTLEIAGECSILVNPDNSQELLDAFELVLSEGRHSRRVERGLEKAGNFSWDRTAAETLAVYRRLLETT